VTSGERRETYISTQQASPREKAWFSQANEDQGRACRPQVSTLKGSRSSVGVIGRIPRRVGFTPFRGGRAMRHGALTLRVSLDSAAGGVRAAFSTPKRIGTAVQRNQLRRRLRALLRSRADRLPHGWYLIGADAAAVDKNWGQLQSTVDELLASLLHSTKPLENPNKNTTCEAL
jgi:ribonuclease P protein component